MMSSGVPHAPGAAVLVGGEPERWPTAVRAATSRWGRSPAAAVLIRYWEPLALCAILVAACWTRTVLIGVRPLWLDESFSLSTAQQSFPQLWAFFRTNDAHPIGYYALLSLWIHWFGTGLVAMRLPSFLIGIGAVVLTWAFGRRACSPAVGIVAAALVALNPFQIYTSNEMRMYALLTALALVSTWCLWDAIGAPSARGRWAVYGVSVVLLAYTSYYAALLVAAQVLWALGTLPWRRAAAGVGVAAVVALVCYAPWMPVVWTLPQRLPWPWRVPANPYWLGDLLTSQTFGSYLFGTGTYFTIGHAPLATYPMMLLPFAVLVAVGATALRRTSPRASSLLVVSWLVPLALVVAVSLATGHQFAYPYHVVFLEPFAALLVAAGIVHLGDAARLASRAGLALPLIAAGCVATFLLPAVAGVEDPTMLQYRWDLAAQLLRTHATTGDAIVYFPSVMSAPVRYYYHPRLPQAFIPVVPGPWTEATVEPAIQDGVREIKRAAFRRVWLVLGLPWPPGSAEALVRELEQAGYTAATRVDFGGIEVGEFDRASAR